MASDLLLSTVQDTSMESGVVMAANKQYGQAIALGSEWFGGTVADVALQQTELVPVEKTTTPMIWQMGTVWGTVTSEIAMPISTSAEQQYIN